MEGFQVSRPNFPEWAPNEVISEWEEKAKEIEYWYERFPTVEPETEDADLLARLLTYTDMRSVWERLPKYKIKPTLFSSMVQCSLCYIDIKPYNLTSREHEEWVDEVRATASKLKSLIQFTDYDRIFQEKYLRKRQKLVLASMFEHSIQILRPEVDPEEHEKTEPSYKSWPDLTPPLLSDVLSQIAKMESPNEVGLLGTKSRHSVRLDRPNHPNAKRSYFVRSLTQELRDKTGQPLRDIVTITTATVFDAPTLTERQIIRMAP
ncbi:hypothetical protein [Vibrio vulnificus]|uniref:hypothetical protein n=1 Tax=Vibrio vulnificus TaxID=672 RepID=UPI0009B70A44|nr:hypothetical protein [Vibrio vulnificus]OQK33754.1 hypothetical protein XM74_p0047 [Vibrio vulnificus]